MGKILIPVDGSPASAAVIGALPKWLAAMGMSAELHLVNVQHPVSRDVRRFVGHEDLQQYHREEGMKALGVVRDGLVDVGWASTLHILLGDDPALTLVDFARERGFDQIFMTTHGRGGLSRLLLGSVASEVVRLATVPVMLVK